VVLVGITNYSGTQVTNGIPTVRVSNCVAGTSFDIIVTNQGANALAGILKVGFCLL
jgi:hypothetical protein